MRDIDWSKEVGDCKLCGNRPGFHNERYLRCGNKNCQVEMDIFNFDRDFDKMLKAWNS